MTNEADIQAELAKVEQDIANLKAILSGAVLAAGLTQLQEKKAALQAQLSGQGLITQDSRLSAAERGVAGATAGGHIITGDHNRLAETIIEQQTVIQQLPGDDPAALRTAYLERVLLKAGHLSLAGVDPKAITGRESDARLNLSAVYTALLTFTPEQREQAAGPDFLERGERRLSALAQLDQHARLVLLGDPGSGKSTFVNFVAMCLAGQNLNHPQVNLTLLTTPLPDEKGREQEERQPWQYGALLPLPVTLRDFAARGLPPQGQTATAKHLWDFIAAELTAAALKAYIKPLSRELLHQGGLLLLDGLDEVPQAGQRRVQIKQAVEDFAATFKRCRILVTSRTYAYQKQDWRLPAFSETVLAPFSRGQIIRFVDHWYAQVALLRNLKNDDARGRAELLKRAIFGSSRLQGLAERPLLLTLMASLHAWRGGSLPEKREELYADAVDLLLDTWESRKVERDDRGAIIATEPGLTEWLKVDRDAVRGLLNRLAYQAHAAQPETVGTADVTQGDLVSGLMDLSRSAEEINPALLVRYLSQRAGLLLPRGVGVYTFPHRTFQEYLAACHLTDTDYPDKVAKLARSDPNRWREVALLAGAKAAGGTSAAVWLLVEALCWQPPARAEAGSAEVWGAHLAGQMLVETISLEQVSQQNRPKVGRVKQWLIHILEAGLLPAVERAAAGRVLAALGDDRPGVGLRSISPLLKGEGSGVRVLPDIAWCDVPAGLFIRGSPDDSLSFSHAKETPQQKIDPPAFRISRYPVTNAQYATFVKAGGYGEAGYWTAAAANGYWQGGRVKRFTIEGKEWAEQPHDFGRPFNLPNHPVVGVNWYEAVAFCAWLTEQLRAAGELGPDDKITLPAESQWEKAARGADGRLYPWGNKPEPELANCRETGLGNTTAVGCFPGGAGPYGVQEMSGNVWEWCRTKFEKSYQDYRDDNTLEQYTSRVLRGGSFANEQDKCRCAARFNLGPNGGGRDFGFRVVASPFTSGL